MEQLARGLWMSCSYGWSHTSMVGYMSYQIRTRLTDNLSSCWRYLHQCVPYVFVIVDGVVEVWLVCFHSSEFQYNPHCMSSVNDTNRLYYVLKTGSDGTLMQSKREIMIIVQHHIGSYSIILGMVIPKIQDRNNIVGILRTIFRIWMSSINDFVFRCKLTSNFVAKCAVLVSSQHWFRQWLGAKKWTIHYLNQWWQLSTDGYLHYQAPIDKIHQM